ncbi:MAG: hypothetical protein OHK0053_34850 [Microscillaceae bacterium]
MKKLLFLHLLWLTVLFAQAQTNLSIFSQDGERFWLVVNGVRQNVNPSANVRVEALTGDAWKAKVVFANEKLLEIDKTIYTYEQNTEQTYVILKNRKNEYVMRIFNQTALPQPPSKEQEIITYHETITEPDPPTFRMRIGEFELEINDPTRIDMPPTERETPPNQSLSTPCRLPMSNSDFREAQTTLEDADFEDTRFSIAKQIANSQCLTSQQVKSIMEMFSFEETRLEFAKYVYVLVYDARNFYIVNEAFDFSQSVDELEQYIDQNRH